jgi:hypothetical protein
MNKAYKLFFLLFIGLVMTCCDPAISYEYNIQNNSNKEFQVGFVASGLNFSLPIHDSIVTIRASSRNLIAKIQKWGSRPHDEASDFLKVFDTLYIVNNDSLKFIKDIYLRENWEYDNDINYFGIIKTGTNYYTLKINDADFNSK